jgi:hypothetical protein
LKKDGSNKPAFSEVSPKGGLEFIAEKVYDPEKTYKK